MKTKEFIRRVEELGYETSLDGRNIDVLTRADIPFCSVCRTETMQMSQTYYDDDFWNLLTPNEKEELFNLMVEYARTPIDEREEEKKFYLRHRWENKQLTLKEIEEIKERYDTDLSDFDIVEVEE